MGTLSETLVPKYDSAKSFYGKAVVNRYQDHITLVSYRTEVATVKYTDKGISVQVLIDALTKTTTRHVKEFLKQLGVKADSKSQIIDDYGVYDIDWR